MNVDDHHVLIKEEEEWSTLICEALHIGIEPEEIRRFLQTKKIQDEREIQLPTDQKSKLYSLYQMNETIKREII